MVWTVCKGTVRQIKQMLDWRRHLSTRSLQVTKWSTAASARPAEGLGRGGRDRGTAWGVCGNQTQKGFASSPLQQTSKNTTDFFQQNKAEH